jgi:uncharacterized cupredoxin-like copper-binding protein
MSNQLLAGLLAVIFSTAGAAWAHGDLHGRKPQDKPWVNAEQKPYGKAGDPGKVTRTITMDMDDSMHYSPAVIKVKPGETIRFAVKNSGKLLHEIVLGTMPILKEHGELMKKFPDMDHDEPHMAHVKPGKTGQLVWHFNTPGEFYYACLIPGHLEAGMIGKIVVAPRNDY